jgi:hypothetical protein
VVKNGHFVFDDGNGNEMELDYNRHFPNLQSLTLFNRGDISKHWKECWKIYKVFFPFLPSTYEEQPMQEVENNEDKSFKNLVYLDIGYCSPRIFGYRSPRNYLQRMEMISRNFPNVQYQFLN